METWHANMDGQQKRETRPQRSAMAAVRPIGAKPVKAYKGILLLKLGPTEQNKTEK